jgi:dTDP-4-dehydrorhamnose 3,5-epimerase
MGTGMSKTAQIDGVRITALRQIVDSRGAVLHMLRSDDRDFVRFGECYFSEVAPGAVKAWKRHREQTQNLAVPVGRVRLVIYDDRSSSPTHGAMDVLETGRPDAYCRITIPPGLWYGFASLGGTPALLVNCPDAPHDPLDSESTSADDPAIPYSWDIRSGLSQA